MLLQMTYCTCRAWWQGRPLQPSSTSPLLDDGEGGLFTAALQTYTHSVRFCTAQQSCMPGPTINHTSTVSLQ
jgi:hypothetical protein